MNDRGENIVNLARNILHPEALQDLEDVNDSSLPDLSFKTFCLTVFLAAFGGSAVTSWVEESRRPINHYEKVELDALFFYAAQRTQMDEKQLRQRLQTELQIRNFNLMTVRDFERTQKYLYKIIP